MNAPAILLVTDRDGVRGFVDVGDDGWTPSSPATLIQLSDGGSVRVPTSLLTALDEVNYFLSCSLADLLNPDDIPPPEPVAAKPVAARPVAAQPVAARPVAARPVAAQPVAAQPVAAQPVAAQPVAAQPVAVQEVAAVQAVEAADSLTSEVVSEDSLTAQPIEPSGPSVSAGNAAEEGPQTLVAGRNLRVRQHVRARTEQVDVSLLHEDLEVTRVAVDRIVDGPVPPRQEGDVTIYSVLEEVLVVEKRLVVREELHVRVRRSERVETRQVDLQNEELAVEEQTAVRPAPGPPAGRPTPPPIRRSEG